MDIEQLKHNWQKLGKNDPLWAVLSWPDKKGSKWAVEDFFRAGQSEIRSTINYTKEHKIPLNYGRALDFGCGVGRLTLALGNYFSEVIGVDIAPAMIEQARRFSHQENCRFIVNAKTDLKIFPDNYFSFIYSRLTFQHMKPEYTHGYIQEFFRILEPGGVAIFSQPYKKLFFKDSLPKFTMKDFFKVALPTGVQNLARALIGKISNQPVMELYSINKETIASWLQQENLKVLYIDEFGDLGPSWICYRYFVIKPAKNKNL